MDGGIYALLIMMERRRIKIGSLGNIEFKKGYYVYIGSSQKNLNRRIERHYRKEKKLRWHIDYLLQYGEILDYTTVNLGKEWEEKIAKKLEKEFEFIPNFGSSDSHARSHLFYCKSWNIWERVKDIFNQKFN